MRAHTARRVSLAPRPAPHLSTGHRHHKLCPVLGNASCLSLAAHHEAWSSDGCDGEDVREGGDIPGKCCWASALLSCQAGPGIETKLSPAHQCSSDGQAAVKLTGFAWLCLQWWHSHPPLMFCRNSRGVPRCAQSCTKCAPLRELEDCSTPALACAQQGRVCCLGDVRAKVCAR